MTTQVIPACDTPVAGGCSKPAKAVIVHRASENLIGNGMAVWSAYFRCEEDHYAKTDAGHIRRADPEAVIYVFGTDDGAVLSSGRYAAHLFEQG
jgi:hypothetical protein